MRNRAFTLLELAVVVAILAVLAAILFPVFGRTHCGNSRTQSCYSNLKFLGVAFMQYRADYDDRFPLWVSENGRGWADQIHEYGARREHFHCPSTPNKKTRSTDYALNVHLLGVCGQKLKKPNQLILLAEGENDAPVTATLGAFALEWKNNRQSPLYRHAGERSLLLLVDGSAKSLSVKKMGESKYRFVP